MCCTDCPEVQAVTRYDATEPDELVLEESDVINVFRKCSDGKSRFIHRICGNKIKCNMEKVMQIKLHRNEQHRYPHTAV